LNKTTTKKPHKFESLRDWSFWKLFWRCEISI